MKEVYQKQAYRAARASSYDRSGRNRDYLSIEKGKQLTIELKGPGSIRHIWMAVQSPDVQYLRKVMLLIYWDNEQQPSVAAPLGDFFGLGHARSYSYQCALFSTSVNTENEGEMGAGVALNCWIPMPFKEKARIAILNDTDSDIDKLYYYIDYRIDECLPEDIMYLHAVWTRENPTQGFTGEGSVRGSQLWRERIKGPEGVNLTGTGNFIILSAKGEGHYIGMNLSIDNLFRGWWGEGDDMIFVDRDDDMSWPPDLHGTGSEDYLCHAWGMQKVSYQYCGMPWAEKSKHNDEGKCCVYRYHVADPIPFTKSILVSMEHGTANCRSDDWACCAYWYQKEPHYATVALPSAAQRMVTL